MKEVPLSEIKDDLSRFLRQAEKQEIVITQHGTPAGVAMTPEVRHFITEALRVPYFLSVLFAAASAGGLGAQPSSNQFFRPPAYSLGSPVSDWSVLHKDVAQPSDVQGTR